MGFTVSVDDHALALLTCGEFAKRQGIIISVPNRNYWLQLKTAPYIHTLP